MLTGQNGILNRAANAKEQTSLSQIDEKIKLANAATLTRGQGTLDYDVLKEELANLLGTEGEDWNISDEEINPWIITVGNIEYNIQHEEIIKEVASTSSEWEVDNVTLVKYKGNSKNILIPNTVDGVHVTKIGYAIFANSDIETLKISRGITEIESAAFSGCTKLTGDLIIPNTVTKIESSAFSGCNNIKGKLVLPKSVTSINSGTFSGISFTDVEVDMENIPQYLLSSGANGTTGTLKLGNNVKTIGNNAFAYCNFTGDLIIPNSVTVIESSAFYSCNKMKGKLVIPSNVATIGTRAFYDTAFENIEIDVENIPENLLNSGGNIKGTLKLGEHVKKIGKNAFYNCKFTGDLNIPNSVIQIDEGAFNSCGNFNGNLSIPNSVESYDGISVFVGDTFLDVYIDMTEIPTDFMGLNGGNITGNLKFGNNVRIIKSSAFRDCDIKGDVIIPEGVTTIEDLAFYNCKSINSIKIPKSVINVGFNVFYNFTSNQTIYIEFKENEIPNNWNSEWKYNCNAKIEYLK